MGWLKKTLGTLTLGIIPGLQDDGTARALQQQNELMLQDQQNRLNAMLQQNLLDASNANSNLTSVVTGDTLTVAENIKKRKKTTDSVSSSLGL